jgi:hypothetical protein
VRSALISLAMLICLAGCSATQLTSIPLRSELVQEPTLGEVRTSEAGDTLVKTARLTQAPAIHITEEVVAKGQGRYLGNTVTLKPGTFPRRFKDATRTCYMEPAAVFITNFMAATPAEGGICIDNANPALTSIIVVAPVANAFYAPTTPIRYEPTTYVDRSAPGFYQELIYNGKAGEAVKFLYREFQNDMARPAFSQDVSYDLHDGNVVGFKGARVEILDASNTSIKYKVLAHFPLPQ